MTIGNLVVSSDTIQWLKAKRKAGKNFGISDYNIPRSKSLYDNCLKACQAIIKHDKRLEGHPIMCLAGAFWTECGWQFNKVYNKAEAAGKGNAGTNGYVNAGESWFGITFWEQKLKIIKGMNLPCQQNKTLYKPGNMICDLPFDTQAKIVVWYLEHMVPKYGNILLNYNQNQTEQNAKNCLGAAYVFKAGNWKRSGNVWEDALDSSNHYKKSVNSCYDGFALAVYMSMMFARYIQDGKVPQKDPWE